LFLENSTQKLHFIFDLNSPYMNLYKAIRPNFMAKELTHLKQLSNAISHFLPNSKGFFLLPFSVEFS
jgi:hypothetical protein